MEDLWHKGHSMKAVTQMLVDLGTPLKVLDSVTAPQQGCQLHPKRTQKVKGGGWTTITFKSPSTEGAMDW